MNRRRHMSLIGRHSSPPLCLWLQDSPSLLPISRRPSANTLGNLANLASKPNAAIFNDIPAAFLPYIPEISECPICFKKGFIKRLTQEKKSVRGNWYQQVHT